MQMLVLTIMLALMHMLMYLVYPVHVVYLSILSITRLYSYRLFNSVMSCVTTDIVLSYFICLTLCAGYWNSAMMQ